MKCFKCQKEMDREDGGPTIRGIEISLIDNTPCPRLTHLTSKYSLTPDPEVLTVGTIEYNNLQLGKYSNGSGECDVAICYECYIDGLFHIRV